MDTRDTRSSSVLVPILSNPDFVLQNTHGHESYTTTRDLQKHAHHVTRPSECQELIKEERKGKVVQPVYVQEITPPQDKVQSPLAEDLKKKSDSRQRRRL